ncbi:MAG: hypothetical protein ACLUKF_06760 [Coprococcus comes]
MKKKKSGKRILAIVLLVVIGIGGFYFGYDIGRMDHDEERIRAELKRRLLIQKYPSARLQRVVLEKRRSKS